MAHLPPVGFHTSHSASYENSNLNTLTVFVLGTLSALTILGSLACYRWKAHSVPAYFNLGQEAFAKGQFALALQHFDNALVHRQAPSVIIHYQKALAHLELEDFASSLKSCDLALKIGGLRSPAFAPKQYPDLKIELMILKADLYLKDGQTKETIEECTRVLQLAPNRNEHFLRIHLLLALAYHRSTSYDWALTHYKEATRYNSEPSYSMAAIILYNQALAQRSSDKSQDAGYSLEWAQETCRSITTPILLRWVLPLPAEWEEKIDPFTPPPTPLDQLKKRIEIARRRLTT